MARTLLTVQPLVPAGFWPTFAAAAAAGNMFDNTDPRPTFLHVRNGSASPMTVTIPSTLVRDGLTLASRVVTIPATTDRLIGPILGEIHNQLSGVDIGRTYVDYSAVTTVTVAVLRA